MQPQLAMAIASGGIRPVAALPVLAMLERNGLAPAAFAGCSGGGVIAALAAAGLGAAAARRTVERLLTRELFARRDARGLLTLLGCRLDGRPGLLRPDAILRMYREVFGARRIEELPLPLALQATDLDTGEGVVLRRGPVVDALYASSAAPPLLPPIKLDGRWLADGALSDPAPLAALPPAALRLAVLTIGPDAAPFSALARRYRAPEVHEGETVLVVRVEIAARVGWRDVHLLPGLFAAGEQAAAALASRLPSVAQTAA